MNDPRRQRWDEIDALGENSPAAEIELLRRFVADYPDSARGWRRLGNRLAKIARFEEALAALQRAEELADGEYALFVYCSYGDLFRQKGNDAAAEQWYRRALTEYPDHTQGYIYLGALLAERGRLAEAEETHRRGTLSAAGCIDEAYYNLGLVLRALEHFEEAAACFRHAIEIDPQYEVARAALADVERAITLRLEPEQPPPD